MEVTGIANKALRFTSEEILAQPSEVRSLLKIAAPGGQWVPYYPAGRIGILVAPGGMGKSQAVIQLAISVCAGRPWLSSSIVPTETGGVALLMGEETREEIQRRVWRSIRDLADMARARVALALEQYLLPWPLSGERLGLIEDSGEPSKRAEEIFKTLCDEAPPGGWRLVVLDPAARFMGGDTELDSHSATAWIALLEAWTAKLPGQPAILVAHHTRKSGGSGSDSIRGSSALRDGARWLADLRAETDKAGVETGRIKFAVRKSNYCRPGEGLALRMRGGVLVEDGGD